MKGLFTSAWVYIALSLSASSWASTSDSYQAGISAFKSAQYEEALTHFMAAREAGMEQATLHYNLGSTYYKLGQFRLAVEEFSTISEDPTWGGLAHYNLGLITSKMGDEDRAKWHFRAAKRQANTDKLRQLAAARLVSERYVSTQSADSQWLNYLSLSGGFDDNVILADDETLSGVSGEDDYFVDLAAFASGYVAGNFADGWRLDLGGGYRRHNDLNDFDFGTGSLTLMYNRMVGSWHLQGGVKGGIQLAGGDHYTTEGTLRMRAYHRLGAVGLRLTNDLSLIEGASAFDYLTGVRNQSTMELVGRMGEGRWRAGYRLEINDRDDLTLTEEFFSYSPTRHGIFGHVEIPFTDRFTGEARADYRISNYDDENIEIEVGDTVIQDARDAERSSVTLRLAYRIAGRWQVFSEFQYSDNESDIGRYSYDSTRYRIGIDTAL